jgi:aldehyde dehydrogenase (NAD+)
MAAAAAITPIGEIPALVASVRAAYASGATLPYSWRAAQLTAIIRLLEENRPAIHAALAADLRKPLFEADINEIEIVVQEARHALSHLASWMAPQAVPTPLMHLPASACIRREPLGVALLILPWNFPFCACAGRRGKRQGKWRALRGLGALLLLRWRRLAGCSSQPGRC